MVPVPKTSLAAAAAFTQQEISGRKLHTELPSEEHACTYVHESCIYTDESPNE